MVVFSPLAGMVFRLWIAKIVDKELVLNTEITERDTIILEDTSVAANPTPGSYTAAYIASCGVTMETPTWTITNTDNSGEIILNEHEDYAWIEKKDFYDYDFAEGDRDILSLL